MSTVAEIAISETYEDTKRMMYQLIHRCGVNDFDEGLSTANEAFVIAYKTHKSDRAKFTTWLYHQVRGRLLSWRKAERKRENSVFSHPTIEIEDKRGSSLIVSILNTASDDVVTVIRLILNSPPEIHARLRKGKRQDKLCFLQNYLQRLGWTMKRITESFSEIRRVLG